MHTPDLLQPTHQLTPSCDRIHAGVTLTYKPYWKWEIGDLYNGLSELVLVLVLVWEEGDS